MGPGNEERHTLGGEPEIYGRKGERRFRLCGQRLLAISAIRETFDIEHIKQGYYSIKALNPTGIVPLGPATPANGC